MKALREVGLRRALRFGFMTLAMVPYRLLLVPQRVSAYHSVGVSISKP